MLVLLCIVTYNNYIAKTTGNLPLEIDCCSETCKRKNTSTFSVDKFRYYYVSGKKGELYIGTVFCSHICSILASSLRNSYELASIL